MEACSSCNLKVNYFIHDGVNEIEKQTMKEEALLLLSKDVISEIEKANQMIGVEIKRSERISSMFENQEIIEVTYIARLTIPETNHIVMNKWVIRKRFIINLFDFFSATVECWQEYRRNRKRFKFILTIKSCLLVFKCYSF